MTPFFRHRLISHSGCIAYLTRLKRMAWFMNIYLLEMQFLCPGPRLMTDTQHSTLKTQCIWMGESWVWSVNPECRVLSIHHKFWVQALTLWPFLSILHLKLQHQIHVFEWGILKCGRIHILRSGIPNQIHGVLSVECWVSVISLGPGTFVLSPLRPS